MITAITAIKRTEIESLATRLNARGESVALSDQPEMQKDLRLAARVIWASPRCTTARSRWTNGSVAGTA